MNKKYFLLGVLWLFFIFQSHLYGTSIDLNTDTSTLNIIYGETEYVHLGYSSSSENLQRNTIVSGDINGDGYDDLIVSEIWADPVTSGDDAGKIYIFYGPIDPVTTIDLNNYDCDAVIYGKRSLEQSGNLCIGDINGDGKDDIVIGAMYGNGINGSDSCGQVAVVFGKEFPKGTIIDLSTDYDVLIWGMNTLDLLSTIAVGDFDNDNKDDIIMGAINADSELNSQPSCGEVYVVYGGDLVSGDTVDLINDSAQVTIIYGADTGDMLGSSISCADINGDNVKDLILGAIGGDGNNNAETGCGDIYVIYSTSVDNYMKVDAEAYADLIIYGADEGDSLKFITTADINSDGKYDILASFYNGDGDGNGKNNCGEVRVLFGDNFAKGTIKDFGTDYDILISGAEDNDCLYSIAAGDLNGDNKEDIILGAPAADGNGNLKSASGEVYVIYNNGFSSGSKKDLSTDYDIIIYCADSGDSLSAVCISDINNDLKKDLIIGAGNANGIGNGRKECGEIYIYTPQGVDNSDPLPAQNVRIESLSNSKLKLIWNPSPSSDMNTGKYNIYITQDTEILNDTVVSYSIYHTGNDIYNYETGPLLSGHKYTFLIRVRDSAGNEEKGYNMVSAYVWNGVGDNIHTEIVYPKSGEKIYNDVITLCARLNPDTYTGTVNQVLFEYRPFSDTGYQYSWSAITELDSNYPNPSLNKTGSDYILHWNAAGQGVSTGLYEIRAKGQFNGIDDDSAPIKLINIVDQNPDKKEIKNSSNYIEINQTIYKNVSDTVIAVGYNSDFYCFVNFPENSLTTANDTDVLDIKVISPDNIDNYITNMHSVKAAGAMADLSLSSNQTNFSNGLEPLIILSYKDDDNDSYVEIGSTETTIKVDNLYAAYFSSNQWNVIDKTSSSFSIDKSKKQISFKTNHFTFFAIVAPSSSNSVQNIIVYPNPYKPNDNSSATGYSSGHGNFYGIFFDNVPPNTNIKIFTILGELVDEFYSSNNKRIQWDVKNKAGKDLASGMYIWTASGPGGDVTGNIAIIK